MSHNPNSAWTTNPGGWHDPLARFHTVFTTMPTTDRPVHEYCVLCVNDAWDPIDPSAPNEQRNWSLAVAQRNWWVKDATGHRIQGWGNTGNGRYAVDLSKVEPWTWLRANLHLHLGFSMFYYDDLSMVPQLPGVAERVDLSQWRANATSYMMSLPANSGINGGKDLYTARDIPSNVVKLEFSKEHPPWGNRNGHPMTWNDWVFGKEGWGPGVKGIVDAGKTCVMDVFMQTGWTAAQKEAHANAMMATCLLFDRVYLMMHDNSGSWWRIPYYVMPCCEWWKTLGDPLNPCHTDDAGLTWKRHYTNGTVTVNGDGTNGRIVTG